VKSSAAGNDDRPPPYQSRDREPSPVDQEDAAFAAYDPPGGAYILLFPTLSARFARRAHRSRKLTQADTYAHCALGAAGGSLAGSVSPVSYGSLYSIERLLAAGENLALVVAVDPDDAHGQGSGTHAASLLLASLCGERARACRIRACMHPCMGACMYMVHAHECTPAALRHGSSGARSAPDSSPFSIRLPVYSCVYPRQPVHFTHSCIHV